MAISGSESARIAAASYDEMPYPSSSFSQTHPSRLAAIARLFGVPAPAIGTARVLELGCYDGGNLIPMAARLPQARFLGLDASPRQVAAGRKLIEELGLRNVEIRQQDILDFSPAEGAFDYIIAHGVYSWVPAPVREKVLAIASANLAPSGIAYISYNALPGSGIRMMLRELAFFHARGITDAAARVRRVRELLGTLAGPMAEPNLPHHALFRQEFGYVERAPELYLRHDLLEEENHALYFHQFVAAAAKHRLQYLGEPSLWEMVPTTLGPKARAALQKCERLVDLEQQMDFLRFRAFRQTLLCRENLAIQRQITAKSMGELSFQPRFRASREPVDLAPGVLAKFAREDDTNFVTTHPLIKAALAILSRTPGRAAGFGDLVAEARGVLTSTLPSAGETGRDEFALMNALMELACAGLVELHSEPMGPTGPRSERPLTSPLVRYQAANTDCVTNWVHAPIALDPVPRQVLIACDGQRTPEGILEAIVRLAEEGKLAVADPSVPVGDRARLEEILRPQVLRILDDCSRLGVME